MIRRDGKDVAEGLAILVRVADEGAEIPGTVGGFLIGPRSPKLRPTIRDIKMLEVMGWRWSDEFNAWVIEVGEYVEQK